MKFLVIFVLALATASAFDFNNAEIKQRNVVAPVVKAKGRITNGQNAAVGQFPYQVGLSLQLGPTTGSWCGGSLIGPNWVLTAAHCTEDVQSVTVFLGATVRTLAKTTYTVSSSNIFIHDGYNSYTLVNDISLIKIPSVNYSARIQPVKLPAISGYYSLYVGEKVIASGWGNTYDSSGVTNYLQWARFEIVPNSVCAETFGNQVTASNICVATPCGVSTCFGDSGGPLVLQNTNLQVGLTSFGSTVSCTSGYPAAFTRLTSYLDWIKSYTGIAY